MTSAGFGNGHSSAIDFHVDGDFRWPDQAPTGFVGAQIGVRALTAPGDPEPTAEDQADGIEPNSQPTDDVHATDEGATA